MNVPPSKSLLPDSIKKPAVIPWIFILPQTILLLINLRAFWLVWDEIRRDQWFLAISIISWEICLLFLAGLAWGLLRSRKSHISLGWNVLFLIMHIGYLWYASFQLGSVVSWAVEPWIIDASTLVLYQFTFIMPGLFYAGLRLACFEMKIKPGRDIGISLLLLVTMPALYFLFALSGRYLMGFYFPVIITMVFFIGVTVLTFAGLTRLVVLLYNWLSERGEVGQIIFAVLVAIVGPLAGLYFNQQIPFPADFQVFAIYVLAVINGLVVLIPQLADKRLYPEMLFLRSATFPFTFYFFLVFLPFLPLSLPAILAMGMGFLILVPVVLFMFHSKKIADDFKMCAASNGKVLSMLIVAAGISLLPGYFIWQAGKDKAALNKAIDYVYAADYRKDLSLPVSSSSMKRVLLNLKKAKEGTPLPYISDFYDNIVFEGMVLPDKKIEQLYRLFVGEEIPFLKNTASFWGRGGLFGGIRQNRMGGRRAVAVNRQVELTQIGVNPVAGEETVKSVLRLEMRNTGESDNAEFFRELNVPAGVLITGFKLRVVNDMVPGQIFEKKAAQWVYHMIRDFTRRDPGILSYKTFQKVDLNVYPFLKDETRVVEIEFEFPAGFSPQVTIGDKTVDLLGAPAPVVSPIRMAQNSEGNVVVLVPEEQMETLLKIKREPYLHFILDFSKKSSGISLEGYAKRIAVIAAQFPGVRNAKITAANFEVSHLSNGEFVDVGNQGQLRDAVNRLGLGLSHQGALDISRVIKSVLLSDRDWGSYPLFIVITNDKNSILDLEEREYFRDLLPDVNYYFVADKASGLEKVALWDDPVQEDPSDVVVFKMAEHVSVLPVTGHAQAGVFRQAGPLSVYDPSVRDFRPVNDIEPFVPDSSYSRKLDLLFDNYEMMVDPSTVEASLPGLVKRSRESGVLIPSTSYIVVERSSQWKTLQLKEKEALKASRGLEFDEQFETPAPSVWILMILLALWSWGREKRRIRISPLRT